MPIAHPYIWVGRMAWAPEVREGQSSKSGFQVGLAMRLRQMRNDAENAHICAYMREYLHIRIDVHRKKVAHGQP